MAPPRRAGPCLPLPRAPRPGCACARAEARAVYKQGIHSESLAAEPTEGMVSFQAGIWAGLADVISYRKELPGQCQKWQVCVKGHRPYRLLVLGSLRNSIPQTKAQTDQNTRQVGGPADETRAATGLDPTATQWSQGPLALHMASGLTYRPCRLCTWSRCSWHPASSCLRQCDSYTHLIN